MKSSNTLLKKFENEKYDIVVLAGQSNAHGHGLGPVENEFVPDERISLLTDDADICFKKDENGQDYLYLPEKCKKHISIATEFGTPENKTGNFALIFAKKYLERGFLKEGRKLLILRAAVGGTGFAKKQWGVGNVLYERLVDMTKVALDLNPENRIVAILWHQGEHDAFENAGMPAQERSNFYFNSITAMFNDYFDKFGLQNIPFIAGGFVSEWYLKNKDTCDAVYAGMKKFLCDVGGKFVNTEDLPSNNEKIKNYDDIHFCRESLYTLGERYFAQFEEIIK